MPLFAGCESESGNGGFLCLERHPLVAVFVVVALIGSANAGPISDPLSGIDPVIRNKSCFTGPFSSHKSWGDDLAGRNQEFNRERFEQKYPREKFEHYRASLVCRFFAYKVDEYEIGGFLVAPRAAKNVPAIIFNRGGTATFGQLTFAGLYANVFDLATAGALKFASRLQARWHPYRLIIFENDDHFFSRNAQEAHRVTVEWFKRYL